MKRWTSWLLAVMVAALGLIAGGAWGQVTRYYIEDGDAGTFTPSGYPERVKGQAAVKGISYACAANACTRTAPSGSSSPQEGIVLSGVGSYIVTLALSSGTFSGTGVAEIWVYVDDSGNSGPSAGWYYVIGKDITPPSGKDKVVTAIQNVSLRPGNYRLVVRPNTIATSAAAPTLTMTVRACQTATCAP